ncbi:unnamed protein product [Bursaphelenchus xylophilus]|nr:unnamed protein product [Bursaphelenchus xylophilus]CAG9114090.1 unnamed protein product [Bursaphelenchus xylophilus]
MSTSKAHLQKLRPAETALFVCDLQESSRGAIQYFSEIVQVAKRLIEGANILNMQILATGHWPDQERQTVCELELEKFGVELVEKTKFSMCVPLIGEKLKPTVKSVIICGTEAHACVLQSVLDLLSSGYQVHVVVDATSSRGAPDRFFSFRQMEQAGAVLTTSECALLGLIGTSDHPKFEEIRELVKESAPDTGLLQCHL